MAARVQSHAGRTAASRILRRSGAVAVMLVCAWGVWCAWRVAAARLITAHARSAGLLEQADRAVALAPNDPEAHSARGFVLLNMERPEEALPEYERAAALRPRDYFLWLELGQALDVANDGPGAEAALRQAVSLAPSYAQPRWQLGNVLLRANRRDEAFAEFRRAASSDPSLLPGIVDLAWGSTGGDARSVEQLIRPETPTAQVALAKFFVRHGATVEAMTLFRAAGGLPEQERRAVLTELLNAGRFEEAYEVWRGGSGAAQGARADGHISLTGGGSLIDGGSLIEGGSLTDGGFEGRLSRDEPGFGWQPAPDAEHLHLSLDTTGPRSGAHSLRIEFKGDADPNRAIISQLVLAAPNARYRLRFAARTHELVTGGPPLITVSGRSSKESRLLALSAPLSGERAGWQEYAFEFRTGEATRAVLFELKRQNCGPAPCPIFGQLWLDDFALERL
ncbi:MAG TPA: tetratricopeptide repeat protein [Pyrinomonadaceae bacterium]